MSHVVWECSACSNTRVSFRKKLQELLENDYEDFESLANVNKYSYVLGSENDYEDFESLANVNKYSYVLGSELWESKFDGLLGLVKELF